MMPGSSERQAMNALDLVESGGGQGTGTPSTMRALALGRRLQTAEQEVTTLRARSPIDPVEHDVLNLRVKAAEEKLADIRRIVLDDPSHALLRIKRIFGL